MVTCLQHDGISVFLANIGLDITLQCCCILLSHSLSKANGDKQRGWYVSVARDQICFHINVMCAGVAEELCQNLPFIWQSEWSVNNMISLSIMNE